MNDVGTDNLRIIGPNTVPLPGSDVFLRGLAVLIVVVSVLLLVVVVLVRSIRRRKGLPARRRTSMAVLGATAVLALAVALLMWPFGFSVPEFPETPKLFPDAGFFYRPVTDLPVTADSKRTIVAIGSRPLVLATGSTVKGGRTRGVPFNLVDDTTTRHEFSFTYPRVSDPTGYPISEPAYVQSMPMYFSDNHYIAIDLSRSRMWELASIRRWFWIWQAESGAVWDLDSLRYPRGRTTASGLPLKPLTFTYHEVRSGSINHVLALSMPTVRVREHQWPARSTDGPVNDPDAPVMGTWFRLRSDVDLSRLGPQARVIAEALQTYGAVLSDTGGSVAFAGETDARWDDADLATLRLLNSDDLEVVDTAGLMVDPGSMEVAPLRR